MGDFSATDAISAGFRLIARNPLALAWWILAYITIGVLPQVLALGASLPDIIRLYQSMGREAVEGVGARPDMTAAMGLQSRMLLLQPVLLLSSLVSQAVLVGAIYRGVLEPENRRFGWIRFSSAELWLGLVMAVAFVMIFIVAMVAMVVFAIVFGITAVAAGKEGMGGAGLVMGLAILVACIVGTWGLLRLSLAFPMSFAQRKFMIFESWPLTRGHALKMFGVAVAVLVIAVLLEILVVGVMFGVGLSALATNGWGSLVTADPEILTRRILPWVPVWILVGSVFGVAVIAIMVAPWAEIYRQLAASSERAPA